MLKSLICSGISRHLLIEKLSGTVGSKKSEEGFTFNGIEKKPQLEPSNGGPVFMAVLASLRLHQPIGAGQYAKTSDGAECTNGARGNLETESLHGLSGRLIVYSAECE